ncbi:MAG TPA: DUF4258 domain-containing protein [Patescibacteria group bacterium]|nr:DUF4258 domain-containing protein [Patescibacteria group bacterium]
MDKNFGGVIWTNHAIQRLYERGIKQGDAWATWRNPEQSRYAASEGSWIYYRTYGDNRIEVVAKQNDKKEWIILSVWSKKVYLKNTNIVSSSGSWLKKFLNFFK